MLRVEVLGMELPEGHEDELAGVRVEGRRLAQVLDDLLGLARAENAGPVAQATEVGPLVAERVEGWRALAQERGVQLAWTPPDAPLTAMADPIGLSSALDAVLDNALKFTPGGETVRVEVVRVAGADGEHGASGASGAPGSGDVAVRISDAGPGLDQEELARIGDRFWRSPRHQNVDGSGLGLSIARALVAANGGSLSFDPHQPRGLTVTLTLPGLTSADPAARR
jgi:signal transduction histidine kinase